MKNKEQELQALDAEGYNDEISEVAYSYWESRGCENGYDVEDWLMAEQEVIRRHRVQSADRQLRANAA
jgi:hypothetical protein